VFDGHVNDTACVADVYRTAHWEGNTVWDSRSGQVPLSYCLGTAWLRSSVFCIKEVSDHCTDCVVSCCLLALSLCCFFFANKCRNSYQFTTIYLFIFFWIFQLQYITFSVIIVEFEILTTTTVLGAICIIVAQCYGNRSNCCSDIAVYGFLKWRPSTILGLFRCVQTTHKEYLVVLIVLQNLAGIGAVVSVMCQFLVNVNSAFTFAICCRPSVRLSVVCNAPMPYSGGWNFRQYFYGTWYSGHPATSTENFTEIVPGEPLRRGS